MNKKFAIQSVILLIVMFTALYIYKYGLNTTPQTTSTRSSAQTYVEIKDLKIKVEVADSSNKRTKGLGERESLATDSGMLFIFPKEIKPSFWMKGVKFPLDIIWIKDKKVVDILKNVQPAIPNTKDEDLLLYQPNQLIDMALEVNAGFVDTHNIKIGDEIKILQNQ